MSNGNEKEKDYDIIETQNSFQNVVDRQSITIMNDSITIRNLTDIISGELILYVLMLTILEQLSSRLVTVAAAAAASPSHSELIKFEFLSDSTSSLNSLSSTLRNTFYISNGVVLSAKTNWIAPVGAYKDHCYLCNYFGYRFNICPNIRPEFLRKCCKC